LKLSFPEIGRFGWNGDSQLSNLTLIIRLTRLVLVATIISSYGPFWIVVVKV